MIVYFIQVGERGPFKIGHSSDPLSRLMSLQLYHYQPLYLRAVLEGRTEYDVHRECSSYRIRGEWFKNSAAIRKLIATLPPINKSALAELGMQRERRRSRWPHALPKDKVEAIWFDKNIATNDEAAEKAGVPKRSLYRLFGSSGRPAGWPANRAKK